MVEWDAERDRIEYAKIGFVGSRFSSHRLPISQFLSLGKIHDSGLSHSQLIPPITDPHLYYQVRQRSQIDLLCLRSFILLNCSGIWQFGLLVWVESALLFLPLPWVTPKSAEPCQPQREIMVPVAGSGTSHQAEGESGSDKYVYA